LGSYVGFNLGGVLAVCRFDCRAEALREQTVYRTRKDCPRFSRGRKVAPIVFCRLATARVKEIARRLGVLVFEAPHRKRFLPLKRLKEALSKSGLKLVDALRWFPEVWTDGEGFLSWVRRCLDGVLMLVSGDNWIEGAVIAALDRQRQQREQGEERQSVRRIRLGGLDGEEDLPGPRYSNGYG